MLNLSFLPKFLAVILFASLYFIPLLLALFFGILPAFKAGTWLNLWQDSQTIPALTRTLISAILSSFFAVFVSLWLAKHCYQNRYWRSLISKLPAMLSFPHVAFAVGFIFLIAPSGWLVRALYMLSVNYGAPPDWSTVNDTYAISLSLALSLKEIPFLLWNISLLLADERYQQQYKIAICLGYSPKKIWTGVIQPQILSALRWPLVAVIAYSITVVDVAQVIGPDNPPTFAVVVWQWLSGGDFAYQAQAHAGMLLLALLTALVVLLFFIFLHFFWCSSFFDNNKRGTRSSYWQVKLGLFVLFAIYTMVFLLLFVWSFADAWSFPHLLPQYFSSFAWHNILIWESIYNTLLIAFISSILALLLTLFWLEWGWRNLPLAWLIYLPLSLPSLLLVAGQYQFSLLLKLDGTYIAVVISHLAWVFPYFLLVLLPAYKKYDDSYLMLARNLGCSHFAACVRVKWPMLLPQIAAAFAISFSVSVALYLPTLFIGAGRYPTLTTEAVAMSSGGSPQLLAANSICLAVLPLLVFVLAQSFSKAAYPYNS